MPQFGWKLNGYQNEYSFEKIKKVNDKFVQYTYIDSRKHKVKIDYNISGEFYKVTLEDREFLIKENNVIEYEDKVINKYEIFSHMDIYTAKLMFNIVRKGSQKCEYAKGLVFFIGNLMGIFVLVADVEKIYKNLFINHQPSLTLILLYKTVGIIIIIGIFLRSIKVLQ